MSHKLPSFPHNERQQTLTFQEAYSPVYDPLQKSITKYDTTFRETISPKRRLIPLDNLSLSTDMKRNEPLRFRSVEHQRGSLAKPTIFAERTSAHRESISSTASKEQTSNSRPLPISPKLRDIYTPKKLAIRDFYKNFTPLGTFLEYQPENIGPSTTKARMVTPSDYETPVKRLVTLDPDRYHTIMGTHLGHDDGPAGKQGVIKNKTPMREANPKRLQTLEPERILDSLNTSEILDGERSYFNNSKAFNKERQIGQPIKLNSRTTTSSYRQSSNPKQRIEDLMNIKIPPITGLSQTPLRSRNEQRGIIYESPIVPRSKNINTRASSTIRGAASKSGSNQVSQSLEIKRVNARNLATTIKKRIRYPKKIPLATAPDEIENKSIENRAPSGSNSARVSVTETTIEKDSNAIPELHFRNGETLLKRIIESESKESQSTWNEILPSDNDTVIDGDDMIIFYKPPNHRLKTVQ